jgi:hypothetical protein
MNSKKYSHLTLCLIVLITTISACSSPLPPSGKEAITPSQYTDAIAKKWLLSSVKPNKSHSSELIMSLEKNGYFTIYDSITDAKFLQAGIKKIQPISNGQWDLQGKTLTIHYLSKDSNSVEKYEVREIIKNKLVLLGKNKKKYTYYTY